MKRRASTFTALLLSVAGPTFANGPEIGIDAGMIVPIASTHVELESEWVDVFAPLGEEEGRLECLYRLRNRSRKAVVVRMGFLVGSPSMDPKMSPSHWDDPALGLEASLLGGEPLVVRRERVRPGAWSAVADAIPDSIPVWEVPIPADSAIQLQIRSRITWSGGSDGNYHGIALTYAARPARLWAGSIGRAVIEFHLGDVQTALIRGLLSRPRPPGETSETPGAPVITVRPEGHAWTWEGIRWTFEHWEPTEDVTLRIDWADDRPGD